MSEPALRALSLFEDEPVPILGGALDWVPVRRRLGVSAFGVNAYRAAQAGPTGGPRWSSSGEVQDQLGGLERTSSCGQ